MYKQVVIWPHFTSDKGNIGIPGIFEETPEGLLPINLSGVRIGYLQTRTVGLYKTYPVELERPVSGGEWTLVDNMVAYALCNIGRYATLIAPPGKWQARVAGKYYLLTMPTDCFLSLQDTAILLPPSTSITARGWRKPRKKEVERENVEAYLRSIFGDNATITRGDYYIEVVWGDGILTRLNPELRPIQVGFCVSGRDRQIPVNLIPQIYRMFGQGIDTIRGVIQA